MAAVIDLDCFGDAQVGSKLWLVEMLERTPAVWARRDTVWFLGGWYGMGAFVLLTRGKLNPNTTVSFDIDPTCEKLAESVCNHWRVSGQFRAYTRDVNKLDYRTGEYGLAPDIVINLAVEHIDGDEWFSRIPSGTLVAMQATDMPHDEHTRHIGSAEELERKLPLSYIHYKGSKLFKYPHRSYSRFMVIGDK